MTWMTQGRSVMHGCGLVVAPVLWAAATQSALLLPPLDCRNGTMLSLIVSSAAALLSLVGAGLSLAAIGPTAPRMRRFIGLVSALAGLIFAYALTLQAAASLLVDRCQS